MEFGIIETLRGDFLEKNFQVALDHHQHHRLTNANLSSGGSLASECFFPEFLNCDNNHQGPLTEGV